MSWSFDTIPKYVINLDRRHDRWYVFNTGSGVEDLTNLRRWSATDGKTINVDNDNRISLFTKYSITRGKRRSHMELNTKGGVGCYISHTDVWKNFLEKSESNVGLILEDDAIINSDTLENIKTFINNSHVMQNSDLWDFCILAPHAGAKMDGMMYPGDKTCMRLKEFSGFTGYLFTKKGINKVLPNLFPIQGHIDWYICISSQLNLVEVCCPVKPLIRVNLSFTDIQKFNGCDICDIETDFGKDSAIVSKWRLRMYQIEEIFLALSLIYLIGKKKIL
jgi:GR25 family glycosyltransferase involved in LPS biosynthesis